MGLELKSVNVTKASLLTNTLNHFPVILNRSTEDLPSLLFLLPASDALPRVERNVKNQGQ